MSQGLAFAGAGAARLAAPLRAAPSVAGLARFAPGAAGSAAASQVPATLVAVLALAAAGLGRAGRRRSGVQRAAWSQAVPVVEEEDEAPTPFPADKLFPPEAESLLLILQKERPNEEELLGALEELQDLHEYDRQWVRWPRYLDEAKKSRYSRGLFHLVRGVLRCIGTAEGEVRFVALDLLASLLSGGSSMTRVPPNFIIECGAIPSLCRAARETADESVFNILTDLVRNANASMIPSLLSGGAAKTAIDLLEDSTSEPMEQLSALDLLCALAKRAPAKAAQAGAYQAVMNIQNPALCPRRNKIMTLLRPIMEEGDGVMTNIKLGGLKF